MLYESLILDKKMNYFSIVIIRIFQKPNLSYPKVAGNEPPNPQIVKPKIE